jgi:hypothetical protein
MMFLKDIYKRTKQVEQFLIETAAYRRRAPMGGWGTGRIETVLSVL